MRSLRTRLFVFLVAGSAVLFLAAGIAVRTIIATRLQREFDRGLEAKARALVALTDQEGGQIEFDFWPELMPEFAAEVGGEYFELWLADGSLLHRSPSFEASSGTRAARLTGDLEPAPARAPGFRDLPLPDGRRGRQVRIDFVPALDPDETAGTAVAAGPAPGAQAAILVVAREREGLDADVRRLELVVAGLAAGLTLALAGLTQLALRVGLRSLDRLTRQVRALDVTSLDTRVEVEAPPEEIRVVVEQVNALLDRLEAGFRRERRLSSDIAHELKTPIAELRSLCEVGARWPEDREAVRRFFDDARAIALHMERLVTHLVELARYEEGGVRVATAPVPVADVVEAAWKPLAREAAAKGIVLRQQIGRGVRFDTDADKFALLVANLLANAVAHGAPDTVVACTAEEHNGRSAVSFSNRAEHLEPQDLAVMFDRFWRKDEARAGGRHVGLGLALARTLADLLGIEISTRLEADRTFRVTLSRPSTRSRGASAGGAPRGAPSPGGRGRETAS